MNLGLVLGGVAKGATDTYTTLQNQARLQQAADDAHAMEVRKAKSISEGKQGLGIQAPSDMMDLTGSVPDKPTLLAPAIPADPPPPPPPAPTGALPTPAPSAPIPSSTGTVDLPTPAATPAPAYSRALATGPVADEFRAQGNNMHYSPAMVEAAIAGGQIESGLNPNVKANGSSTGLMQFHPSTFKEMGGTDINDPHQQIAVGLASYAKGAKVLPTILGREPTPTDLYIYHQQGAAGGPALLTADPKASAIDTLVQRTGMSLKTAQQSIQKNWPHAKGESIPSDPTVGQFLGAYQNRVMGYMTPEAKDHPVGATPPADDPAPLVDKLPSMQRGGTIGGAPGVYPSPDGSGNRYSANVRVATQDDLDNNLAAAYTRNGLPDEAQKVYDMVAKRNTDRQAIHAKQVEEDRLDLQDSMSKAQTVSQGEHVYNQMIPTGQHVRIISNPDKSVTVHVFDNDTRAEIPSEQTTAPSYEALRSRAMTMLADPGKFMAAMDTSREVAARTAQANATGRYLGAEADTQDAENTAGKPQADVDFTRAQGAEAQARTSSINLATNIDLQRQILAKQITDEQDPVRKAQLQARYTAIGGAPGESITSTPGPNGLPVGVKNYAGGLKTVQIPGIGEVPYDQQEQTKAAFAQAAKDKIPLTTAVIHVPGSGHTQLFGVGGNRNYNAYTPEEAIRLYKADKYPNKPLLGLPDLPDLGQGAARGYPVPKPGG